MKKCIGTYSDQEHDPEVGLYNFNARLYDPAIGIFISPDSIVQDPFDPQTFNRYAYARNNPIIYTDPSGHLFLIDDILIGAVIGGVKAAINGDNIWQGALTGAIAGTLFGAGGAVLQAAQIADPIVHAAIGIGSGVAAEKIGNAIINTSNDYLVQPTLYWVNAFNNVVIYPAFDLLALPDQLIGAVSGTTFEERMAWAAQFPGGIDDVALGAVGVVGRLPKVLRGIPRSGTEIVQRAMSRAELNYLKEHGVLRFGRTDTTYVSNAVNSAANRARQRLALPKKPEVRATLEVSKGLFSYSTRVKPLNLGNGQILSGGGMERIATGQIPAKILKVHEY